MAVELKNSSHDNWKHEAFPRLIESLSQVAQRRGRHDVLSSFCDKYLALFFSQQLSLNASPEAMFDQLVGVVDVREELHDMERRMDKEHFTELLVGGYFAFGGIDKKDSVPICWTRSGLLEHESKSSEAGKLAYVVGSPKALAFLRASVFYLEIAQTQSLSRTEKGTFAVYFNESDRRVIDFDIALTKECLRLLSKLFPVSATHVVVVAGGFLARTVFEMIKVWCPRVNLEAYDIIAADEVYAFVEEPSDVPAFWIGDGSARVPSNTNRRNLWCYERCLQDDGKITTRDVFNPGPWPYAEEATDSAEGIASTSAVCVDDRNDEESSSVATGRRQSLTHEEGFETGLATIEENPEDCDW